MKRIFTSFFVGALLATTGIYAQEHELCSQYQRMLELEEEHPGFMAEVEENQQRNIAAAKKIAQRPAEKSAKYTIPVVFHVIYEPSNPAANISDDQIYEAVEITNAYFAGTHSSIGQVIPEFKDRIGYLDDIQIKIATIDPEGNCTNGINRYEQVLSDGGTDQEFKSGRQWPTDQYLNFYIVPKIASGAAGYSNYPNNAPWFPTTDGVVLLYNYLGSTGASSFGRSFTLVHEIGHYLDLPHVWGNSNNNDVASNCGLDDGIADTPLTQGSTTCDVGRRTCNSLDNVQNFMDYSYCSYMFTNGQGDRMRAALESSVAGRNNLWNPANLEATGVDYEGMTPDFLCSADFEVNGSSEVCPGGTVSFTDRSYFGVSDWEWTFEGGEPATSTEQNPSVTYTTPGEYDVTLTVTKGGQTETITKTVVSVIDNAYEVPVSEQYTNSNILDPTEGKYLVSDVDGDNRTWQEYGNAGFGDENSLRVRGRFISGETVDHLTSRPIDLTGLEEPTLQFAYAHAYRVDSEKLDRFVVSVSEDCGETFQTQILLARSFFQTAPSDASGEFIPQEDSEWRTREVSLDAFKDKTVLIRFSYEHNGGNNVYLDALRIDNAQTIGIDDNTQSSNLNLWPNPSNGTVHISGVRPSEIEEIIVLDVLGKQTSFTANTSGAAMQLALNNAKPGIYLVQIVTTNGAKQVHKISVTK